MMIHAKSSSRSTSTALRSRSSILVTSVLAVFLTTLTVATAYAQEGGGLRGERQGLLARMKERRAEADVKGVCDQAAPGQTVRCTISHGGDRREYMLHLPKGYTPSRQAPLLVAMHGGGGSMDNVTKTDNYGILAASDARGFIVVAPNGSGGTGLMGTWNAGNCCGHARDKNVDDVGFIRSMISEVSRSYAVDASRIYATGMSNGGMLAQRLACEASDVFAAVASVAGTDNTVSCNPTKPISVLNIHARDDELVLFNGGAGTNSPVRAKAVTEFTSVPETFNRWIKREACTAPVRRNLEVPGAYCEVSEGCAGGGRVQVCVTEEGSHSWPGSAGTIRKKNPASQAINANDVMWSFFDASPRRY